MSGRPSGPLHRARMDRLRSELERLGLAGLLVTYLPNLRYLTGFTGSTGLLLVGAERTVFITDFRYAEQAEEEVGEVQIRVAREGLLKAALEMAGGSGGPWRFEADHLSVAEAQGLEEGEGPRWLPVTGLVEGLRATKDPEEVALLKAAVSIVEGVLDQLPELITPGLTERGVAVELEYRLRQGGAEGVPFPPIVATGPRASRPHARASDRVIEVGDLVLVDLGATVDGYQADLTRVVALGEPSHRARMLHGLVQQAQEAAVEGLRAGRPAQEVDALARGALAREGLDESFGHSLGHGVGLEVHEAPRLASTSEDVLAPGMVVTVEPGVYLPGWGGIRIEDEYRVSSQGPERLSRISNDLLVIEPQG